MKLFVGTNIGHGSALAALNESGELVFAADEDRLSGRKGCDQFPAAAMRAFLNAVPADKLLWAEGWDCRQRLLKKGIFSTLRYGLFDSSYFRARLYKETRRICQIRRAESQWRYSLGEPSFAGHHLAHAYSLLPWGLPPKSVIIVSDTTSEAASISIFYWCGSTMTILCDFPYPHSLGAAYHQMARHLGFLGKTGPGKLMALAGYGKPTWLNELRSIFKIDNQVLGFDLERFPAWHRTDAWRRFATHAASPSLRQAINESHGCYEGASDLARSIQDWFTLTTLEVVENALRIARDRDGLEVNNIGLAGGAALNCQTNGYLVSSCKTLGVKLFVSPWSDDPGTAVGAAAWLFHRVTGSVPATVADAFWGPEACGENEPRRVTQKEIQAAARVLQDGGIVALVSGRLEFGPRALGHRCLLGDPRRTEVRDKLNRMKKRPWFMPVAPVVLENDLSFYFVGEGSTNMAWTLTPTARGLKHLPAAIHASGQARVQLLRDNGANLLVQLLKRFRALTNTGALLLTSLNGKDEPIAANVDVARKMVRQMEVDAMLSDTGYSAINA